MCFARGRKYYPSEPRSSKEKKAVLIGISLLEAFPIAGLVVGVVHRNIWLILVSLLFGVILAVLYLYSCKYEELYEKAYYRWQRRRQKILEGDYSEIELIENHPVKGLALFFPNPDTRFGSWPFSIFLRKDK